MATSTDTIQATIEAWQAAQPEGTFPRFQLYEPNGGIAIWTPAEFASEDFLAELLGEEWETAAMADGTLDLFRHRGPVLRYASLTWGTDPSEGREQVAYLGAHSGFVWEDDAVSSDALEVLLRYCAWDDEALAEFGLTWCGDFLYGDDGSFWLVADPEKFAAVAEKCQALDREYYDLDAEDVLAFLRDGTKPEVED